MNKQKCLLYEYSNEIKKYFDFVHNRLKKIVQEKAYKLLLMIGKTAQKVKLLNDYVNIAPKKLNILPEIFSLKKFQQI